VIGEGVAVNPERMSERSRRKWEAMTPEQRAAVAGVVVSHRTPEYLRHAEAAARLEDEGAPEAGPKADLLTLLAELRAERERQGLSLADVSERSGIERSMLNKLELGKIANPTVATLRAFAAALGGRLTLGLALPVGASRE
jgi:ribosome-binding protein aMBF1 (putative translation factor)